MATRRISKASKRRLTLFGTVSIIAIIYFIFSIVYNAYILYNLTIEKKTLEDNYIKLQEKAEKLKIDIEKLSDEEYLANYARENYLYSKDGEYIIQIDAEEVEETSNGIQILSTEINRNYVVFGLSILIFIIFIYIILKGRKKTKKRK